MDFCGISTSMMQMHLFPTAPWYISISLCVKYFIFLKGLTDIRTGPMQVNIQSSKNRFFKFSTISASCIFDISVMSSIPDLLWSADSLVYAAYENSLSLQYYVFYKIQEFFEYIISRNSLIVIPGKVAFHCFLLYLDCSAMRRFCMQNVYLKD